MNPIVFQMVKAAIMVDILLLSLSVAAIVHQKQFIRKQKEMNYLQKSKSFVKKLIKIREQLIRIGASKKDASVMKALTANIKYWLASKNDSSSMAVFIQRNANKLYLIMPGESAPNHNSLKSEFENLLSESIEYIEIHHLDYECN